MSAISLKELCHYWISITGEKEENYPDFEAYSRAGSDKVAANKCLMGTRPKIPAAVYRVYELLRAVAFVYPASQQARKMKSTVEVYS